jgi:ADP-ribose pyrophosphatase YjhB (NUDIX family)
VQEETGYQVEVTTYLGTWIDAYADHPAEPDAGVINVAYYVAVPVGHEGERGPVDPAEVSEAAWFAWDQLPRDLAPPRTLEAVLSVAHAVCEEGGARMRVFDRRS